MSSHNPNDLMSRSVLCNNCLAMKKENTALKAMVDGKGETLFPHLILDVYCLTCQDKVEAQCTTAGEIICTYCNEEIGLMEIYEEDSF